MDIGPIVRGSGSHYTLSLRIDPPLTIAARIDCLIPFDDNHSDIDYRIAASLYFLYRALKP